MPTDPIPDHWVRHAEQWKHVGPPLRPSAWDVGLFEQHAARAGKNNRTAGPRAVLLGVTPEIAGMRWPPGTTLTAVDRCPGMIKVVWPEQLPTLKTTVVRSDWRQLPGEDGSADIVIGDGCFTPLEYPVGYRDVIREVRRILQPDGAFILRLFVRPSAVESVQATFAALERSEIENFHVFKWRLAMAVQGEMKPGVRVGDIWDAWHSYSLSADALSRQRGWSINTIRTIDVYRDGEARYTFPTLDEVRLALAENFVEEACHLPPYELGERCPILMLRPRQSAG